jgi:hypothetical protein
MLQHTKLTTALQELGDATSAGLHLLQGWLTQLRCLLKHVLTMPTV